MKAIVVGLTAVLFILTSAAPPKKDLRRSAQFADALVQPGELQWPRWPRGFAWSNAGPIRGMMCVQIFEASDPHTWADNYFCSIQGQGWLHAGIQWSSAGPISGMRCTQILEPSDPHTWSDNFLCVPYCSPYLFKWSFAGPLPGHSCIQWVEPSDPHTWGDNYLCM